MTSLALPSETTNILKLADWLEIYALISADGNSSRGDLENALRTASVFEPGDREAVEAFCLQVFFELEQRATAAGDAYPFIIDGAVLTSKPNRDEFIGYIFCLFLSYFRWSTERNHELPINPWLLFEELSCIAAAEYLSGEGVRFGTSRSRGDAAKVGFKKAIKDLCKKLGEGKDFKEQPVLSRQDDKVDLIVWKHFSDRRTSKIVMFGQCAAGDNWISKVTELQPSAFWRQWMVEARVSPHLRSFYIPHRVAIEEWDLYARKSDILFDRCRVAFWAFRNNSAVLSNVNYGTWYNHIIKTDILGERPKRRRKATKRRSAKGRAAKRRGSAD
ncbi:MAG TPA: hypothetical protein VF297_10485 [Pyrinomonadaceae bacterium]